LLEKRINRKRYQTEFKQPIATAQASSSQEQWNLPENMGKGYCERLQLSYDFAKKPGLQQPDINISPQGFAEMARLCSTY